MSVTTIQVQANPSGNSRSYHVRQILTRRCEFYDLSFNNVEGVASLILEVMGITFIIVHPYQIDIFKAQAYSWEEIEPKILEILAVFV